MFLERPAHVILNSWILYLKEIPSFFSLVLQCSLSSFRLSLSTQFCMLYGSCSDNPLINWHWTTYLAHLPNPFCLVNFLNHWCLKQQPSYYLFNLQVFFPSFSTLKDGNFTNILNKIVWMFFNLYRQEAYALQMVVLLRSRHFLGYTPFPFQ